MDRRERRFDQLFSNHTTNINDAEHRSVIGQLEKLRMSENKLWWDAKMLKKYRAENMIPRGLRIKKQPTTLYDMEFQLEWNNNLSQFSFTLMDMIIKKEEQQLVALRKDIESKEKELEDCLSHEDREKLLKDMTERVKKQEDTFIQVKQKKYERDLQDYRSGTIYNWRDSRPKSILKKQSSRDYNRRRNVSFSRYSSTSDAGSFISGESDASIFSDDSANRSDMVTHFTRSKNAIRRGEEDGSTRELERAASVRTRRR